uniref:Uncharacterized protein n=1 Tax=Hucho hucho TaxID=62062 RepID=A0A4W5JW56_9TELE
MFIMCPPLVVLFSSGACKAGELTCQNGKCVSEKKRCDGNDDCGDRTDESDCGRIMDNVQCSDSTYKCENNKCTNKENPECDGTPDCEDKSDEANCGKTLPLSPNQILSPQHTTVHTMISHYILWFIPLPTTHHGSHNDQSLYSMVYTTPHNTPRFTQ